MCGAPRRNTAGAATALALLLAATLAHGCGASTPADSVRTPHGATAPAKGTDPQSARGTSQAGASRAPTTQLPPATPRSVPPAHPVPAAFRPAPGAPSDAEVRRELAQLDAIQRRARRQALSAAAANLAGLLPWSLEPRAGVQVSVASVFRDYGLGLACGGVLGRAQLGVAHKTAPCGTLITFTYGGRVLTVPVIDRGPYVAGREWDLTGATADALAFPGLGQLEWTVAG
jgi:rare lipoprotein A (RlpA)-like double-psi beta-barrel protein